MNFLGKIEVGAGAAKNNRNTATPFLIPVACNSVYLESDTDDVQFEMGAGDAFATTAARGVFLPAQTAVDGLSGPFRTGGRAPVISIWNPTGGAAVIRVYAGS